MIIIYIIIIIKNIIEIIQENIIQPTQSDYHIFKEDLFNQKISPIDSLGNQYNIDENNNNEYYNNIILKLKEEDFNLK